VIPLYLVKAVTFLTCHENISIEGLTRSSMNNTERIGIRQF
jgi:hypothetical protein